MRWSCCPLLRRTCSPRGRVSKLARSRRRTRAPENGLQLVDKEGDDECGEEDEGRLDHEPKEGDFVRCDSVLVELLFLAARVASEDFVEGSTARMQLERIAEHDQEDDPCLAENDERGFGVGSEGVRTW